MVHNDDIRPDNARSSQLLRQLPSVDSLITSSEGQELSERYGYDLTLEALRQTLEKSRSAILAGQAEVPQDADFIAFADQWLKELMTPTLRPIINGTGIIIHTNLGRAPLSSAAIAAVWSAASGYSSLEFDLENGKRGSRAVHAERLLAKLTKTEAALVVNNNAAAILLMLTALCQGKEVIISRSQMVEIGGGFRVPDVMAQSGATLVEVGTTNRTHLVDYERAITENTAAILVAHHSNFKIIGFTSEPSLKELAALANESQLMLLYDQGSGAILDTVEFGLDEEPGVQNAILDGVHLVTFSGDKLLGGPQAGILCGRADLINMLKKHPLARAVRADKMCLAALTATLARYLTGRAVAEIPVWQMIARTLEEIEIQASEWTAILRERGFEAEVLDGESAVGGGSLPGATLPTKLVAINHGELESLAASLREQDPPIIGRIVDNRLVFDPRTVLPGQEQAFLGGILSLS